MAAKTINQELIFETSDKTVEQLTATYGLVLLQLSLTLKRFAEQGDVVATHFFCEAFEQMILEAKRILRSKMQ